MKKTRLFLVVFVFLFSSLPFNVEAGSVVNISKDGVASVTEARVMQIAGGTLYTRLYWGEAYVRLMIKTNSQTQFYRGTGELTTLAEVSLGNLLDISGKLESASDTLTLIATSIRNSSVQKQQTLITGKVLSVDVAGKRFSVDSKKFGTVTVDTKPETSFIKGNRILGLANLVVGDTITKATGDYDLNTKTLVADSVVTHVDLNQYKPRNFQGTLQSVDSTNLPTSIRVLIDGVSYKVNLKEKSAILKKNRGTVSLSRFVTGDSIRLYGAVLEVDEPVIDAEIIRNLSL